MKRYSSIYPLIFGIIFLIIGIYAKQIVLIILFGVIPIVLSVLLKFATHIKNKKSSAPSQDANCSYEERCVDKHSYMLSNQEYTPIPPLTLVKKGYLYKAHNSHDQSEVFIGLKDSNNNRYIFHGSIGNFGYSFELYPLDSSSAFPDIDSKKQCQEFMSCHHQTFKNTRLQSTELILFKEDYNKLACLIGYNKLDECNCCHCGKSVQYWWMDSTCGAICYDCLKKEIFATGNTKSFTIISSMTYMAPCASAEATESLEILVLDDYYLLEYCVMTSGVYRNSIEIPFGFFATSTPIAIADKINSVSHNGDGFGVRVQEIRKFTEQDILNSEEIQKLIAFDKKKIDIVDHNKVKEFILNKPELGLWLCRTKDEKVVLITDCYDNNAWLHLIELDKKDIDFVTQYTGSGYGLSNTLVRKYPFDEIIDRKEFLEYNTIQFLKRDPYN